MPQVVEVVQSSTSKTNFTKRCFALQKVDSLSNSMIKILRNVEASLRVSRRSMVSKNCGKSIRTI